MVRPLSDLLFHVEPRLSFLPMKKLIVALLCLTTGSFLAAAETVEPKTSLSTPPVPIQTVMPNVNRSLTASPAKVEVLVILNESGYVTAAMIQKSTNPLLNEPCLDAVRQWRYKPAQRNGENVTSSFIQPFSFGNDTFDTSTGITSRPKTRLQVAPIVPEALQHISGIVTVAVQLDNQGKITGTEIVSSSHEELNAITLTAVRQWEFAPAYVNGKAVPSTVYTPFDYVGKPMPAVTVSNPKPVLVDNSELKPIRQFSPRVPDALADLSGEVEIEFVIDQKGYVAEATALASPQPELAEFARRTVLNWKFTPIVRNGVAIPVRAVQPFRFGRGSVAIARIDRLPEVKHSVSPEVPAALQGASGFANVIFEIDAKGQVTSAEIKDASHEDFKTAALAAAKQWTFKPALRASEPVSARVVIPFVFGKK